MKLKHAIWMLIGTYLLVEGNPLLVNGQDLLGYLILGYTFVKIYKPDFSLIKLFTV